MAGDSRVRLLSIYYNAKTKRDIPSGFEGLSNVDAPPHLYEIFPIYKFLSENKLSGDEWLGFFSPKFFEKTKVTGVDIQRSVNAANADVAACLFSSHFDLASLFPNVWYQGESIHPGLLNLSQTLAQKAGYEIDITRTITCLNTAVFSHYLVAKSGFWREWKRVVSIYFDMVKADNAPYRYSTMHAGKQTLIHAFVIERVPTMILKQHNYKTFVEVELYGRQVPIASNQVKELIKLDEFKKMYIDTRDSRYLEMYSRLARKYMYKNFQSFANDEKKIRADSQRIDSSSHQKIG
jgi:hypothetical protein